MLYLAAFHPEEHAFIKRISKWYMNPKCYSLHNIAYNGGDYHAMLRSGAMDTSMANNVCFFLFLASFRKIIQKGLSDVDFAPVINGDDCVIFMERSTFIKYKGSLQDHLTNCGVVCRFENVATLIEEVVWCQTQPVEVTPGKYVMVRNPSKVISTSTSGPRYMELAKLVPDRNNPNDFRRVPTRKFSEHLFAVGACEMMLNHGVPMLQGYASALIRLAHSETPNLTLKLETLKRSGLLYRAKLEGTYNPKYYVEFEIKECARISFSKAFHISIEDQLEQETVYKQLQHRYLFKDAIFRSIPWSYEGPPIKCGPYAGKPQIAYP